MLFGSSDVNGIIPHLYLSIIPFWKRKSNLQVELKRAVKVEQKVAKGSSLQIAVPNGAGAVKSVAFSSDGTRIVTGAVDNTVRIWDIASGTQIGDVLHGHKNCIQSVAFSPDGTRIVSGSSDRTVRIWDATTGTQTGGSFLMELGLYLDLQTGQIVSASDDQTVRIWDFITGTQINDPLYGHDYYAQSVAFSPDGTRIVSGSSDRTVRICDTTTGTQIGDLSHGHTHYVWSVAFSPDGTRIASGSDDRTVQIWDAVTTGMQISDPLCGHNDHVAFLPDGPRLVPVSIGNTERIWDSANCPDNNYCHLHLMISHLTVAFSVSSQSRFTLDALNAGLDLCFPYPFSPSLDSLPLPQ
ncbi:hypothetical protein GYMLUDRAFT_249866 [Collybiopsis luxurians FD-317 M1]|uniref:WD40 repeat-like protein n=1 Tax=Collybiopsis luxurians FD-317 M1 TaxID=944289 RepID=A0A0D0C856_9AGAR|nr:hypothetical protein GYMLUDRAFT_249866 [Collybiopsis luxurians FD-317 M1]